MITELDLAAEVQIEATHLERCRFTTLGGHVCRRRDGRAVHAGEVCWAEARCQVLQAEDW